MALVQTPPYAYGVAGTPQREMRKTHCDMELEYSFINQIFIYQLSLFTLQSHVQKSKFHFYFEMFLIHNFVFLECLLCVLRQLCQWFWRSTIGDISIIEFENNQVYVSINGSKVFLALKNCNKI